MKLNGDKPVKHHFIGLTLLLMATFVSADTVDHSIWNRLLNKHVIEIDEGHSTQVDYAEFKKSRGQLKQYLDSLSSLDEGTFDKMHKSDQLAFLINAYNAWTIELIVTKYPDLESIKDLGNIFISPWKQKIAVLFGEKVSLDHIEHDLIRGSGRYNDPRIHFAVNCASIGCPALRNEAYTGDNLDAQLEDQTVRFLSDKSRNNIVGNTLQLSSIFKWYRSDFEAGWKGANSLYEFIGLYGASMEITDEQFKSLKLDKLNLEFLDYNWKLNSIVR